MLEEVKYLQQRLTQINDDDEEASLKLCREYQTLVSSLKSRSTSMTITTVFSREDIIALQQINKQLTDMLKKVKDHKKQELKKIRVGKKMQLSYLSC